MCNPGNLQTTIYLITQIHRHKCYNTRGISLMRLFLDFKLAFFEASCDLFIKEMYLLIYKQHQQRWLYKQGSALTESDNLGLRSKQVP